MKAYYKIVLLSLHFIGKIALPGALALCMLATCDVLDQLAEDNPFGLAPETLLDQGVIYVDDTGNIEVVLNNLEFSTNPLFSELSFISVWVYKRGAIPTLRCCSGSSSECPQIEQNACLIGVGFSHDLGFTGTQYLNLHPPGAFNKFAGQYYMPVYVSDKEGLPTNFQGDYQDFSSPVNAVGDREQFDLYLGFYYTVFYSNGAWRMRNASTKIGSRSIYSAVGPDFISPPIRIETRFYSQSREDPPGSAYAVPHLAAWSPVSVDLGLFNRTTLRLNEIGSFIDLSTNNDFIEIYNPSGTNVPLEDVYLYRWSDTSCDYLPTGALKQNLGDYTIPAGGFLTLGRSGNTLPNIDATFSSSISNVSDSDCFALVIGNDTVYSVTDSNVIDFYGSNSSGNKYEGSGGAPSFGNASLSNSRCSDGVDTGDNANDWTRRYHTPGAANNCSAIPVSSLSAGQLLLSEVHYDADLTTGFEGGGGTTCTETEDEFYEIYNNSGNTVNLAGATLQYGTSSGNFNIDQTFGNYLLAPGARLAIIAQDAGCYTTASMTGRNAIFRGINFSLSASGATFVLTSGTADLPDGQTGSAIDSTGNTVLDYVGTASASNVYEGTGRAPDCADQSIIRTIITTDTNDNAADWSCNGANGTPGN